MSELELEVITDLNRMLEEEKNMVVRSENVLESPSHSHPDDTDEPPFANFLSSPCKLPETFSFEPGENPVNAPTRSVQSDSEEEVSLARLADRLHCLDNCAESVLDVKLTTISRGTITPLLPPDLVDSESENEDPGNQTPSPDVHSNDDEQENKAMNIELDDKTNEMKVGRWTYSKGATRKPVKSRSTVRLEDDDNLGTTSGRESERLLLHKESQRLLRDTEIHLQEHRPKQFKRFSEFRQSLHGNIVPVLGEPENIRAPIYDHPAGSPVSESQETVAKDNLQPVCDILEPNTQMETVDSHTLDPLNQTQVESSACVSEPALTVSQPLPVSLFPVCTLTEDDEGFVDLGQSVLPVADRQLTPADRLMARFKAHIHTPTVRKESGPIEYSVVTKVADDVSGTEQLHLSSVVYKSETQPDSLSGSQGRKSWRQHRERLKEQMRQRRLEQYEARMKEEGGRMETNIPQDKDEFSDCDREWSEGEEEISSTESTSSSSDSESEEDGDDSVEVQDEDDADDVLNISKQRCLRRCAFADDEAEESEHDEDEDLTNCLDEDESNDSRSKNSSKSYGHPPSLRCSVTNDGRVMSPSGKSPEFAAQHKGSYSRFQHLLSLDDYTDLPGQSNTTGYALASGDKFCLDNSRRPQGTLGPGDVDLFASEYSTILDRTMNPPSMLASTRLDTTSLTDHLKNITSCVHREASTHSQWNDTPYELLYSQKPISQRPSFSNESSLVPTEASIRCTEDSGANSASQDTVLLAPSSDSSLKLPSFNSSAMPDDARYPTSQDTVILASSSDSLLKLPPSSISTTQDSQNEHEQRRLLFTSLSRQDSVDGSASDAGTFDGTVLDSCDHVTQESPSKNAVGRQLFDNVSRSDSLLEKENCEGVDTLKTVTQALDLGVASSDLSVANSERIKSIDGSSLLSLDSQMEHSRRRDLFADSTCLINMESNAVEPLAQLDVPTFCTQSNATSDIHDTKSPTTDGVEQTSRSEPLERDTVKDADDVHLVETNRTHRHRLLMLEDDDSSQSLDENVLRKIDQPEGFGKDILPKSSPTSPSLQVNSIEPELDDGKELEECVGDGNKVDEDSGSDDGDRSDDEIDSDDSEKEPSPNQSDAYESDEEEAQRVAITQDKPKTKKTFRMQNFLDEEAELSGDENERAYYMDNDDEQEDDSDADLDDLGLIDDENVPSGGRLRRQIERVHQRLQADQDQRELRFLKELYFEDGDLYAENGRTRQRRFRWRGLESEGPLDDAVVDDHENDSDGEEDQDKIPFGPMDRWLQGATHHKPKTAAVNETDLDASVTHEDADTADNHSGDDTESAMSASDDEQEEKENTQPSQVLSLGRQAVLKAKTQEAQIVVVPVNKKTIDKPFAPIKSHTLTNYLQVKQTNAPAVINSGTLTTGLQRPNSVHAFRTPAVPTPENKFKIGKRGSLLGRVPALSRSNSSNNLCDSADTDVIVIPDEDSSSSNSSLSGQRRNPAHFLGLRNKVGLSCFNVLSQPAMPMNHHSPLPVREHAEPTNIQNGFSKLRQKEPVRPFDSGKRASSSSTPTNIKRQRSISVFSALL
ncbi:hypothetical protein PHET_03281 [Paragonimus heterotremus]|uniref:Claspin n=1 Tax=Paragonimus heterotremus TaxID=100268 RepID=A0A8J4SRI6_9TREM|nr:hypothetical protein PHET_03281 [Paragonimus heterotremus]